MGQASINIPRFHSSGTKLCSISESPRVDFVAMVIKMYAKDTFFSLYTLLYIVLNMDFGSFCLSDMML